MSDVTQILQQIELGDPSAAELLLPLVYEELRQLAAAKMAYERSDHTLQTTALVHEAYVRLVGADPAKEWESRGHFFVAAAEAMRRILVEHARRKRRIKRGGTRQRFDLIDCDVAVRVPPDELLAIDDALEKLRTEDSTAAEIVNLKYFGGFSIDEAADLLKISRASAYRHWTYARAWIRCEFFDDQSSKN